jgi:uncharacterized protein YqeY
MTIEEELETELRDAMRSGDKARRDVIRQVRSEVQVARSAPGFEGEVDDALYRSVLESYVKKMSKAVSEYRELGERGSAMAEKLEFEVGYLGRWLPSRLGDAETRRLVESAISELGAEGDARAAGRVTGHIMKTHRHDVDGALVNRLVREMLGA